MGITNRRTGAATTAAERQLAGHRLPPARWLCRRGDRADTGELDLGTPPDRVWDLRIRVHVRNELLELLYGGVSDYFDLVGDWI